MKMTIHDREPFAALNPMKVWAYRLDSEWDRARTRRIVDGTPARVVFPSYLGGVIREAAGMLRSITEIDGFELEVTVYQLRQDTEAIVLGLVDGRYRKVRLTFPPEFREEIIRCYGERLLLRFVGELRQVGLTSELLNSRSFSVEETEGD